MSLIRETKLNPIPIQTGYGVPSHISPAGSLYFDFIGKSEYLNKDGIVDWVKFADSSILTGITTITTTITTTEIPPPSGAIRAVAAERPVISATPVPTRRPRPSPS